jgi:hypothetical protein
VSECVRLLACGILPAPPRMHAPAWSDLFDSARVFDVSVVLGLLVRGVI